MAILRPAIPNSPLQQGDLLHDVLTATTNEEGPSCAAPTKVLVVSRNCQAVRAPYVIVARVGERALQDLRKAETLKDLVEHFVTLRSGDGSPDSFYLGELEANSPKRYFAKFDQLFTIAIPEKNPARSEYIAKHRHFSLTEEFAHDLHQRLHRTFASMGFDDNAWWTDGDLTLIIKRGQAAIASVEAEIGTLESELQIIETSGGGERAKKGKTKQLEQLGKSLLALNGQLMPLQAEAERRK